MLERCSAALLAMLILACTASLAGGQGLQKLPPYLVAGTAAFTEPGKNGSTVVLVPHTVLNGTLLESVQAASPEDCALVCQQRQAATGCKWFNYCGVQGGCAALYARLDAGGCQLLAPLAPPNSTVPRVADLGQESDATGGFALLSQRPLTFPGFTVFPGLVVAGSGVACNGTIIPGECAFSSALRAANTCAEQPDCRTVSVFVEGIGGLPGPVAYLSGVSVSPANSFYVPTAYSMSRISNMSTVEMLLYASESEFILPEGNNASALPANDTWLGCALARNVMLGGEVVLPGTANRQPTAEACCRSCRAYQNGTGCNVWNWCDVPAGCSMRTSPLSNTLTTLAYQECELRSQEIVALHTGWPPATMAKGPDVPFTGGTPLLVTSTPVPGYSMLPGRGLFHSGAYACEGGAGVEVSECARPGTPADSAAYCNADSRCAAFVQKPGGFLGAFTEEGVAFFKTGADPASMIVTPSSVLYIKDASSGSTVDSSSGLSAGAIAGIAVGALALVAAALAVAWRRRRRRRRRCIAGDGSGGKDSDMTALGGVSVVTPASGPGGGLGSPAAKHASAEGGSEAGGEEDGEGLGMPCISLDLARIGQMSGQDSGFSMASLPSELRSWVVDPADFTYVLRPDGGKPQLLGQGAFGKVLKAEFRGEVVAAKEVPLDKGVASHKAFVVEACRLHQLRHPHIVGFMGVAVDGDKGILLMEMCEGRDLHTVLPTCIPGRGCAQERVFGWYRRGKQIALDVAKGLNYLHSNNMVHMDIKSSNVLLTAHGVAKLADVGFARVQTKTYLSDLGEMVGTFAWAAPEILMGGQQCTLAVDIYSFGVVLWEIVTGERPSRGHMRAPLVPDECPQEVADLITRCAAFNPAERPTAQQLLQELTSLVRPQRGGSSMTRAGSAVPPVVSPAGSGRTASGGTSASSPAHGSGSAAGSSSQAPDAGSVGPPV